MLQALRHICLELGTICDIMTLINILVFYIFK